MRYIGQDKVVTARKNYGCDACIWITESDVLYDAGFLSVLSFAVTRPYAGVTFQALVFFPDVAHHLTLSQNQPV